MIFTVQLVSLFSWQYAGFGNPCVRMKPDAEVEIDTEPRLLGRDVPRSRMVAVDRDYGEGLPPDIGQRLARAVGMRVHKDVGELRRFMRRLECIPAPKGVDRPAWNVFNQTQNFVMPNATYRMVFALDKSDTGLGVVLGTPAFFRDNVIKGDTVPDSIDISASPVKGYYEVL